MQIRESQGFNLQELWLSQKTVEIDTQSMCGQFGVKPGTKAPEGMCVVHLDVKQFRELVIDGFDHLTNTVEKSSLAPGKLYFLIRTWQCDQLDAVVSEELCGFLGPDVSFIAQNRQIGMFRQHFKTHFQIGDMRRCKLEIGDHSTQGNEQV
jgi:hypothetical protein